MGSVMTTDTSDKVAVPSKLKWLLQHAVHGLSSAQGGTWELLMARIAFVIVCILLVGVWIHPYFSNAFDGRNGSLMARTASSTNPTSQPRVDAARSLITQWRGKEGFWRLGKSADGVWWFVSPEGKQEFLNTVTTVHPFQLGREANGVHYMSRDWNGTAGKYDVDLKDWANKTLERIQEAGFKGLGAWCHPIFHELDVPISRDLNLWAHYPGRNRLYSKDFEPFTDELIGKLVKNLKDNKNLVGYFLDNELDWSDGSVGPSPYFDDVPADDPNRQKVISVIQQIWPTIADFNKDWKTSLESYEKLATLEKLPREPSEAYSKLFSVWLETMARDYYRITTSLLRKHDPNHLILGVRFAGFAPREVVRASRDYSDAQSINYYVSDGLLDPDMFKMIYEESGQPIIVSEYSFHALDGNSGNRNTFGFQAQVPDQQARAEGYEQFTSRFARIPYFVGADWFQWSDEPTSGRSADGEDVNFGIVDVDDQPYTQLVQAIRRTKPKLNTYHAASTTDPQTDIWRDSFADKPMAYVHKLSKAININGNLSDWSELNRLPGVRVFQTIGIERNPVPRPNVYLGWRDEGMYIGVEVYKQIMESVPATSRWWTRDNVEFWVSTRPVPMDQQVYNANCHQFFFVPNARPVDGELGVVGQWHRPGDAIEKNLVPHPSIVHQSRNLPDRYVMEMFIPAAAMHGWDPKNFPEIAFNLHVRNFNQSLDYFWSAPKEAATQLRPSTWGKLMLIDDQTSSK